MSYTKPKFIDIKYLFLKEKVKGKQILIEDIGTNIMLIDPLIKGLSFTVFHGHVGHMRINFHISLD